MTIDEKVRHDLYEGLENVVGVAPAKLLMTAIPPFSWDNVATKSDIAELKGDIAELKGELTGSITDLRSELKGDIAELKGELTGSITDLRSELKGSITDLRSELKGDITWLREDNLSIRGDLRDIRNEITAVRQEMVREHRWLLFQFLAVNLSMVTIILAFVALT